MADQAPPVMQVNQQQQGYPTRTPHGSAGPVIAVLAVITVLGVIAGMIGRLCSGRRVMGLGEYDLESWVETKCSSCVDGRIPLLHHHGRHSRPPRTQGRRRRRRWVQRQKEMKNTKKKQEEAGNSWRWRKRNELACSVN